MSLFHCAITLFPLLSPTSHTRFAFRSAFVSAAHRRSFRSTSRVAMDEIKGAWLASAMGIFFGWTFLAWLVRAWAKARTHSWSLDDWAISASMV